MRHIYRRIAVAIGTAAAGISIVTALPTISAAATSNSGTPDEPAEGYRERGAGTQDRANHEVIVSATLEWLPIGSEGSSRDGNSCTTSSVQVLVDDDFATPVTSDFHLTDAVDGRNLTSFWFRAAQNRSSSERLFSPTGRWFGAFCDGNLAFVPEGGPSVSIPGLVQQVVDRLNPPDPILDVSPHHGKHAVQMQSWMAIDIAYWNQSRTATARSGRVAVTAWLEPYEVEWDMGNGDIETCPGPGLGYRPGLDDRRATCHYTYKQPSINPPDHTYQLEGTVRFAVRHSTNAPGTYGPFIPVERSADQTIQVVEIQIVSR